MKNFVSAPSRLGRFAIVALFSLTGVFASLAAGGSEFTGEYSMKGQSARTFFHLSIEQHGSTLQFAFDAGRDDGGGKAPEGTGSGTVSGGKAQIKFRDDSGNSGTGTLVRSTEGATLSLQTTHVADPKAATFYAKAINLKQTSTKGNLPR